MKKGLGPKPIEVGIGRSIGLARSSLLQLDSLPCGNPGFNFDANSKSDDSQLAQRPGGHLGIGDLGNPGHPKNVSRDGFTELPCLRSGRTLTAPSCVSKWVVCRGASRTTGFRNSNGENADARNRLSRCDLRALDRVRSRASLAVPERPPCRGITSPTRTSPCPLRPVPSVRLPVEILVISATT